MLVSNTMAVWAVLLSDFQQHPPVTMTEFLIRIQNAVTVNKEHRCGNTCYRPDALPVAQPTASKY